MNHSAQDRERAVQAITRRNMLQRRIKRTQQFMKALWGEVPQALQDGMVADQAALSEAVQTVEEIKAQWHQEEEHIRRKTQEALRLKAEWKNNQFPLFPGGSVPPSPGQILGFLAVLAAMAAIVGGVLLLNR